MVTLKMSSPSGKLPLHWAAMKETTPLAVLQVRATPRRATRASPVEITPPRAAGAARRLPRRGARAGRRGPAAPAPGRQAGRAQRGLPDCVCGGYESYNLAKLSTL